MAACLQGVDRAAVSTKDLTRSFGWDAGEASTQHDCHELNRLLFDAIEGSLKGTQQESLIGELYHGVLVNQVACLRCGHVSEREEAFSDIPIVVKVDRHLEHSFVAAVGYFRSLPGMQARLFDRISSAAMIVNSTAWQ